MLQAIDSGSDHIERMRIAKMSCHRNALVHETDDRFGGVRRHREIELDAVHPGLEQVADLFGHRVNRGHAVKYLAEGPAEALVPSVEQWTKHEKPRTELSAAIQI